jgi:hypothetical protein
MTTLEDLIMKTCRASFLLSLLILMFASALDAQNLKSAKQTDTLKICEIGELPHIDGIADDACWRNIAWEPIDQVWIPYGDTVPKEDFSGKYKIAWSSKTNLLYFLVSVTDDSFVDGYRYDSDPKKGDFYYNYDMLEVFIDEDQSGGLHVFDGTGEVAKEWGTCAANAFSYHLIASIPPSGARVKEFAACDIAGKSWSDYSIANYASHFPEFVLARNGQQLTWEFSLAVYNDRYSADYPESSRVRLFSSKRMGISLAYCDNDDPDETPKTRDNFIGSVAVPKEAYNDHWINAGLFRKAVVSDICQ